MVATPAVSFATAAPAAPAATTSHTAAAVSYYYYDNEHAAGLGLFSYQFMERKTNKQRSILWYTCIFTILIARSPTPARLVSRPFLSLCTVRLCFLP